MALFFWIDNAALAPQFVKLGFHAEKTGVTFTRAIDATILTRKGLWVEIDEDDGVKLVQSYGGNKPPVPTTLVGCYPIPTDIEPTLVSIAVGRIAARCGWNAPPEIEKAKSHFFITVPSGKDAAKFKMLFDGEFFRPLTKIP